MKTPKIYITIFSLLLTLAIYGQQKKIAVLTFYADKNIDLSAISPTADLVLKNTALAQDPTFILTPVLEKFHKAFFTQYLKNLPFEVIEEKVVHENQKYRDYGPISKKGIAYEAAGIGQTSSGKGIRRLCVFFSPRQACVGHSR